MCLYMRICSRFFKAFSFKHIFTVFLVVVLLFVQIRVDVVHSESVKTRYGLVAVLIDGDLIGNSALASRIRRYIEDAQTALPQSKFLPLRVESDEQPAGIQSVLERLYFEGDSAPNEYNKLIGVVIIGDVPLPVVRKGDDFFPSIYPYVDFYRKAYIYDANKNQFLENPLGVEPVPEIWHGIIKPPQSAEEREKLLIDYFDRNHEFYTKTGEAHVFDKKVFFADFFHEKKWMQNEALASYKERMDGMEIDAYSRFTGKLLKELQSKKESRVRDDGAGIVYDVLSGNAPPADTDLADTYQNTSGVSPQPAPGALDDITIPDIHAVHPIRAMWREFYDAAKKFVTEVNTYVENSGRWQPSDADTPASLISKKDKAAQNILLETTEVLENATDAIIGEVQSDITLIDQYTSNLITSRAHVNGVRVSALNSAQDCSLYLGTFDPNGGSQLVEANRKYNPLSAATGKSGYAGCYWNGDCDPDDATNPVRDLSGTQKIERAVYPDYRECYDRVTIKSISDNATAATVVRMSSIVKHKEPTGATLTAQLNAGFTKYLPIDAKRYVTYQANDLSPRRFDYPTHAIWNLEGTDHDLVVNNIRQLLNDKTDELNESIVIGNIGSFKQYLAKRTPKNFDIDTAFNNWRNDIVTILKSIFTDIDSGSDTDYFAAYMRRYKTLTSNQIYQLTTPFDSYFGDQAAPVDGITDCLTGSCGAGLYQKKNHSNFKTFHDFFNAGGDSVFVDQTSLALVALLPVIINNPQQRFVYDVSGLLPSGFFSSLLSDEDANLLADSIVWKNLSIEGKHKYVLENYLSAGEPYLFDALYGYEASYFVADGDESSVDISVQRGYSVDDDEEFSEIQRDARERMRSVQSSLDKAKKPVRADVRCANGATDGVDLWEWVPYIFCWAEDTLNPPFIIYPDEQVSGDNDGDSKIVRVPSKIKLISDRSTFSVSPASYTELTATFLDDSDEVISNFSGGEIVFEIISGEQYAVFIPSNKTTAQGGKASIQLFGNREPGTVRVKVSGTFYNEDGNKSVIESNTISLKITRDELQLRFVTLNDGVEKVDDAVVVGKEGYVEVSYSGGNSDVTSVSLNVSDKNLFSEIETDVKNFVNGKAQFKFVAGKKSGVLHIGAQSNDVIAVTKNISELNIIHDKAHKVVLRSTENIATLGSTVQLGLFVQDEYGNLVDTDSTSVFVEVRDGFLENGETKIGLNVLNGSQTFSYTLPNNSDEDTLRIIGGISGNEATGDFIIRVFPSISIVLDVDNAGVFIDQSDPVNIRFSVVDNVGNRITDISSNVVFEMDVPGGGTFSGNVVRFEKGSGSVQFYPGLKATDINIRATHSGWDAGEHTLTVQPGDPVSLEIVSDASFINVFNENSVVVSARVLDKGGNLVYTDNKTEISLRASDITSNIVSIQDDTLKVSGGVAEFILTPDRGQSGEIHLIAESRDLISGLLALPCKAVLTADFLKDFKIQSLYGSFLGAPIGDSTHADYLAGWFLFGGKMQAITAASRKQTDNKRILSVGENGYFNLSDDMDVYVKYDTQGQDIIRYFDSDNHHIVSLVPRVSEKQQLNILDPDTIISSYEPGISLIPGNFPGFEFKHDNDLIILLDKRGNKILDIKNTIDISVYDNIFTLRISDSVFDDLLAFDIMNGSVVMGTLVYNVSFSDIKLIHDYDDVDSSGLYVLGGNERFAVRNIFTGSSTKDARGYEVVNLDETEEKQYGFREDGVEDVFSKPGIGWRGDYRNMLHFASGVSAGASVKDYLSDIEFLYGDPVISLKHASYYDNIDKTIHIKYNDSDINAVGFDTTVGSLIYRDHEGTVFDLTRLDFNNDQLEDIAITYTNGTVKLLRSIEGDVPMESMGTLLKFPSPPKVVFFGDFFNDGYDDLIGLLENGLLTFQNNRNKKFSDEVIDLKLGHLNGLSVGDFNNDKYTDIVVSNKKGEIYIAYGGKDGFYGNTSSKIASIGLNVDSSLELNALTYVYYPGMQEAAFDSVNCFDSVQNISCDQKNYRESTYIPYYLAQQYDTSNPNITASTVFDDMSSSNQAALKLATETEALFAEFSSLLAQQGDDRSGISGPRFAYYLQGAKDNNLAIEKNISLQGGGSGGIDPDEPLHVSIKVKNESGRTISDFTFADVLPSLYSLKKNSLSCSGCNDSMGKRVQPFLKVGDFGFVYDGLQLKSNATLQISYDVFISDIPDYEFIVGNFDVASQTRSTEDRWLDFQVKPKGSTSSKIVYFISSGNTGNFVMKVVGVAQPDKPQLLKDIDGRSGMSQSEWQQESQGTLDSFSGDDDNDGIPNLFDISAAIFSRFLSGLFELVPKIYAQSTDPNETGEMSATTLSDASDGVSAGISNVGSQAEAAGSAVESAMKAFTCGGCLATPINIAPLSPGMFNLLGTPVMFWSGLAAFSLIPMIPFISPGSNPASYFRMYIDPTLTMSVGLGFCLGPYLSGFCYTVAIPVASLVAPELCEKLNGSIASIGTAYQNFKQDASADLAIVSVSAGAGNSAQLSDNNSGLEYGVDVFSPPTISTSPTSSNKRVPSFPAFFANWFDKQWDEIVNSFMDFSDIILYYPDVEEIYGGKTRHQRNALVAKIEKVSSWNDVIEVFKLMPLLDVKVEKIVIKLPVIFEPNIWDKIEADIKTWWLHALEELVDFLDSFKNISCGSMDLSGWTGLREALIEKKDKDVNKDGQISSDEKNIEKSYIESFKSSDDIGTQISAFQNIIAYRYKSAMEKYLTALTGSGSDSSVKQRQDYTAEMFQKKLEEESKKQENFKGKDIGQCIAGKVGIDLLGKISELVSSVNENIRVLDEYRKFPRKLVQYYDLLGIYLSDVTNFVDKAFAQIVDWMNKNVDRLLLWMQAANTFEEYIRMWHALIGMFEDYKSSCSLCKSDRFTLKDFILRFFVKLPEIPVIPFPNWPDIILDFSEVKMGIPITLPVFEIVFDGGINWPGLPQLELPELNKMSFDVGFNLSASVSLPGIPVLPPPPELPDIQKLFRLPEMPELRLPIAPLPPKLPELFDWIESLTKMIKVFMKIVCLFNQALIPVDEMKLKTQIENLTARPNDPLLPFDLGAAIEAKPNNIFGGFPDFFKLKTRLEIIPQLFSPTGALVGFVQDIANQWNNTVVNLFSELNELIDQNAKTVGDYARSANEIMQQAVEQNEIKIDAKIDIDLNEYDISTMSSPLHNELMAFRNAIDTYRVSVQKMRDERNILSFMQQNVKFSEPLMKLASSVVTHDASVVSDISDEDVVTDTAVHMKRVEFLDKSKMLAQAAGVGTQTSLIPASVDTSTSVVLNGMYVLSDGQMYQLTKYTDNSSDSGDVLIYDFDNDGDKDVVYAYGSDIYFKESQSASAKKKSYPQLLPIRDLKSFYPESVVADMFRSDGDRNKQVSTSWLSSTRDMSSPYTIYIKDVIDGFEYASDTASFFVIPNEPNDAVVSYDTYPIIDQSGDVDIISLAVDADSIHIGDLIQTGNRSEITFSFSDTCTFRIESNSRIVVADFSSGAMSLERGRAEIRCENTSLFNDGYIFETEDAEIVVNIQDYRFIIPRYSLVEMPELERSELSFVSANDSSTAITYSRKICLSRETCDVKSGDYIHALFDANLSYDDKMGLFLKKGYGYRVPDAANMKVRNGVVEIIYEGEKVSVTPYAGMKLYPDDRIESYGVLNISYRGQEYAFDSGALQILQSDLGDVRTARFELPNGYHYARIIRQLGGPDFGTISNNELLSPRPEVLDPLLMTDFTEETIAIFAKRTISAQPYLEYADDSSVYWDLDPYTDSDGDGDVTNDVDARELSHEFGPYNTVGVQDVVINVERGDRSVLQKPLSIRVFVPEVTLSDASLINSSQIIGSVNPSVPFYPVSIVRERPNITEILSIDAAEGYEGPDENKKYYTNAQGEFALRPFILTNGHRILNNDSEEIVRILQDNGRVVLNPSLMNEYRTEVYSSHKNLPLRIVVLDSKDRLIATVYYVPDVDSDVFIDSIVDEYTKKNARSLFGIHVRPMDTNYSFVSIPGDAIFYPGGAIIKNANGESIVYISSSGDMDFTSEALALREKVYFEDTDPVVFEITDNNVAIAEIYIAGNYSKFEELPKDLDVGKKQEIFDDDSVFGNVNESDKPAAEHRFNDVPENSPYFTSVQRLYREGIIVGFEDNTFKPNQPITRAELLKIILGTTSCEGCVDPSEEVVRTYDPENNNPDLREFHASDRPLAYDIQFIPLDKMIHYPDVLVSDWFYYCVEIATNMGIVHGYKGEDDLGRNATGFFLPLTNISRAEAVKVFLEAANFSTLSSNEKYDLFDESGNDISGGWYYGPELNYIFTAVELGLLSPDQNGRVYPQRKISRGEMADMAFKVLNKIIERYQDEDFDSDGILNKDDLCICLPGTKRMDGCPEPEPIIGIPKETGVYVSKGENLCQYIEPIAEAIDGDKFYAVISDFANKKVWRKSNEVIWQSP